MLVEADQTWTNSQPAPRLFPAVGRPLLLVAGDAMAEAVEAAELLMSMCNSSLGLLRS